MRELCGLSPAYIKVRSASSLSVLTSNSDAFELLFGSSQRVCHKPVTHQNTPSTNANTHTQLVGSYSELALLNMHAEELLAARSGQTTAPVRIGG